MGCKCCRMIQRYIFDVPEALNPTELNTSSNNDSETDQEKVNTDGEIVIHKHELQDEEQMIIANNNKLSHLEAGYRNHGSDIHEEGVGNCVEKCDSAINRFVSNSFLYPVLNYDRKQMTETGSDAHLTPFSESVVPGDIETRTLSHFNTSGKESVLEADAGVNLASEEPNNFQDESSESTEENNSLTESAILEMPNATPIVQNGILNDYCQDDYSSADEVIGLSNHARDSQQDMEFPVWKCHTFYLSLDRNGIPDPSEGRNQNELLRVYFKEGQWVETMVGDEDFSSVELNGEDIEDADVAEALAALEAATAGEDEDEEY
uniref:Uncharacterized protein C4orf19 homolog n=1 Tax=Geotrypetes seraphini TaxID=260995 RepID=A0A6P8R6A7_GEOSA|nr:uncharacterized protein C4orf19 homolog [Geotrypetes seraphini]XP_033803515.1 uncharacterized protein C4orf19 homolog [Geotrypetes seraphini]XP_033803525.1 uncharacterized protein C4orf19 homolog [Geotrypetes seraphini]XP_033803535.1 uncharacterized protein C4orf19 homolog [Geotrypetes seraphini]XP_033803542.1 uncharacterized protein C4orf19 homolog [Geotrypetes seraphini]